MKTLAVIAEGFSEYDDRLWNLLTKHERDPRKNSENYLEDWDYLYLASEFVLCGATIEHIQENTEHLSTIQVKVDPNCEEDFYTRLSFLLDYRKWKSMIASVLCCGMYVQPWVPDEEFTPSEKALRELPEVNVVCEEGLKRIVELGDDATIEDFAALKTDGNDKYSRLKQDKVCEIIKTRFGDSAVAWLEYLFDEADSPYAKSSYKWVARGLNPNWALKKVAVDKAISSNAIAYLR